MNINETSYAASDAMTDPKNGNLHEYIDGSVARKMIDDLKDKKTKLKFYNTVWSLFDKDKMAKIYTDPTVLQVKFFLGVFPDDAPADKKDAPVIIMQVTKSSESTLAPVYEYSLAEQYCPPPNDSSCGTLELPTGG